MVNNAGMELLSFLSSHQTTICNTWFEKKDIHKQTWQHPRSKQWSCIDFIVVRQKDRKQCQDVTVKRGAVCNTDHHLVVATMKFRYKARARKTKTKRYDVGKLFSEEVEGQEICGRYLNEVLEPTRALKSPRIT